MAPPKQATSQPAAARAPRPVGQGDYVVQSGECMSSIGFKHGFFWETLWNDSNNSDLKKQRKNPNVLLQGDRVHIPDLRLRQESGATEKRHRFKRKSVPAKLRLQIKDHEDKPRANEKYKLEIDGSHQTGNLDGDGFLDVPISPQAQRALLRVGDEEEEFEIKLGGTDPVTELSGVQHRLNNLGYACGVPDGELNGETKAALMKFQKDQGLEVTGEPDDATQNKLVEAHKS